VRLPANHSVIEDLAAIQRDLAFIRAWRGAKFLTTAAGEVPIVYSPEARNASVDLRSITANAASPGTTLPNPFGAGNSYLATNGGSVFWQTYSASTLAWKAAVLAAGGTLNSFSQVIADTVIRAIEASTFSSKIVYLLPLLGTNLVAARTPLRDTRGVGIASNTGFVNADFSQTTGLQGNGTSKQLDSLLTPGALSGGTKAGGLGYWERNFSLVGTDSPIWGAESSSDHRWMIDTRQDTQILFWGLPATGTGIAGQTNNNCHTYGQAPADSSYRKVYVNGVLVATDSTVDTAAVESTRTIRLLGCQTAGGGLTYRSGRCGVAYATDGTMTDADVLALHTILNDLLITATGR
jgi:hypothetical protein